MCSVSIAFYALLPRQEVLQEFSERKRKAWEEVRCGGHREDQGVTAHRRGRPDKIVLLKEIRRGMTGLHIHGRLLKQDVEQNSRKNGNDIDREIAVTELEHQAE